jgi:hypothetical protein
MALLYANENFPRKVVNRLRGFGHDVLTTHEAGKANQRIPDDQVLAYATQMGRTMLTINRRDFIRLHRSQANHADIILCTLDTDAEGQAQRIHEAIQQEASLQGKLIRIYRPRQ